nr:AzlC family ABC transporter permease [Xenorhabdus sp. Reich]
MFIHYFSCLTGDIKKAIFLVCLAAGIVGISYGSLAMAYGFPLWVPLALSTLVLAGASEFMFIAWRKVPLIVVILVAASVTALLRYAGIRLKNTAAYSGR